MIPLPKIKLSDEGACGFGTLYCPEDDPNILAELNHLAQDFCPELLKNDDPTLDSKPNNLTFRVLHLKYGAENPEDLLGWWYAFYELSRSGNPATSANSYRSVSALWKVNRPKVIVHMGDRTLGQLLTFWHFTAAKFPLMLNNMKQYFHQPGAKSEQFSQIGLYRNKCLFGPYGDSQFCRGSFNKWFNLFNIWHPKLLTAHIDSLYDLHFITVLAISALSAGSHLVLRLGNGLKYDQRTIRHIMLLCGSYMAVNMFCAFSEVFIVAKKLKKQLRSAKRLLMSRNMVYSYVIVFKDIDLALKSFIQQLINNYAKAPKNTIDPELAEIMFENKPGEKRLTHIDLDDFSRKYGLEKLMEGLGLAKNIPGLQDNKAKYIYK